MHLQSVEDCLYIALLVNMTLTIFAGIQESIFLCTLYMANTSRTLLVDTALNKFAETSGGYQDIADTMKKRTTK